ncbi:AcrR family transcriptional regulator [Streptacidiphilus sp. MAP12-16]|uniref:TetR/AcrR family transcriptional regulator n=1 Tax=Streptacidiphilus sp. MAP12-16 TaxID=3156300 RepID=UPI0035183D16
MRGGTKKRGYHHGDLRAALIDTAIDLIGEKGVGAFSLAEAGRRLGVTVAAPYRHFADREALLAAAAERGAGELAETLEQVPGDLAPAQRLALGAGAYVRFAAEHRALFETLFSAGLDKSRHPDLEQATTRAEVALLPSAIALCEGDPEAAATLMHAIATAAHGHAALLLDGGFCGDASTVDRTVARAVAVTHALVLGRSALSGNSGDSVGGAF